MMTTKTETDFLQTLMATLGQAPEHIEPGKFQRFGRRKSCWAKQFTDGLGAVFGDHRQGISAHWSARENQTPAELAIMRRQIQLATKEREQHQRVQWGKNAESNNRLWSQTIPAGDAVRSYLDARGLKNWTVASCVRQHPALAYWHTDDDGELHNLGNFAAMLAPIMRGEQIVAIHRTYLLDGKKAPVPTPKKLTAAGGLIAGACIPLACSRGGVLGIAEGIETAIAATLGSSVSVVAAWVYIAPLHQSKLHRLKDLIEELMKTDQYAEALSLMETHLDRLAQIYQADFLMPKIFHGPRNRVAQREQRRRPDES